MSMDDPAESCLASEINLTPKAAVLLLASLIFLVIIPAATRGTDTRVLKLAPQVMPPQPDPVLFAKNDNQLTSRKTAQVIDNSHAISHAAGVGRVGFDYLEGGNQRVEQRQPARSRTARQTSTL